MSAREANRKSQKLFPLVKMTASHGGVPLHLNISKKALWSSG